MAYDEDLGYDPDTDGGPYDEGMGAQIDAGGNASTAAAPAPEPDNPSPGTDAEQFQDDDTARAWLDDLSSRTGASVEESDIGNLQGKNPEDFEQYQRDLEAQYARRGKNTPGGGGGGGESGGAGQQSLGDQYGGPGSPGVMKGSVQQVGQDPFSKLIMGGYADLLQNRGMTPFGKTVEDWLTGEMGKLDETDPALLAQRMEAARQPIEAFRRMQTNQMRGELANRGLVSEPGAPQGSEISGLGRFENEIAPWYASAAQNLASDMAKEKTDQKANLLATATGLGLGESQAFLRSLEGATGRQSTLANIALQTLDRNMEWNKFLAEYGMDRDQMLEMLQGGRIDDMQEILKLFQEYTKTSAAGSE